MKKRASVLVLSLLTGAVFAQDLDLSLQEEQAPIRRYTVEVIIFSYAQNVSAGTEVFVPDAPPPEDLLSEQMPVDGDSLQSIPEIVEDVEIVDEVDEFEDDELEDQPYTIVMLAEEDFQLLDIIERLDNLDAYTPLLHFGWTQVTYPDEEQEARPLSSFVTPPVGLEGDLTLYLSRYLHLAVNLQLDARVEEISFDYDNYNFEEITPITYPVHYRIEEDRIFRNGELRYFDHPKFGVLAKIVRVEEVEPPEEEIIEEGELLGYDVE